MISRVIIRKQPGRRPLTAIAVLALLGSLVLAGGTALAAPNPLDRSLFELDKNAHDNIVTEPKLGTLGSQITNATITSANVCRTAAEPTLPFTILIDAERLRVTAAANGSFGGNCSGGTKRTYTVIRGFNVPAVATIPQP